MRLFIVVVLAFTGCDSGSTGVMDRDGDGFALEHDCNDGNANVHPDASEVCDGMDNNCNGEVDEGVSRTFFVDADLDGYGDPLTVRLGCEASGGLVEDGTDCNDGSASVSPEASEVCDEVDNDCDGDVDEGVTSPSAGPTDSATSCSRAAMAP